MVYLYQIANDDFILLQAGQPVALAIEALQRFKPTAVIVRRRHGEDTLHYLYPVREIMDRLSHAGLDQSLESALRLQESDATESAEAYREAAHAPARCVIMHEGRLLGFHDASRPVLVSGGAQTRFNLDTGAPEAAARVARSLLADFPEEVPLGQTSSLLVWLSKTTDQAGGLPLAVQPGETLDIVVQPQSGFVLEGSEEASLVVGDDEDPLPVRFKLRAESIGPGRIRILCFHGGQPLGALTLAPTVTSAGQAAGVQRGAAQQPLAPFSVVQPDLTLLILEQEVHGAHEITMRLTAQDPALGLNLKLFGPVRLRARPEEYFEEFFKDIEGLKLATAEERKIATRKLELKGARLAQDLLPEDLRVLLWALRERISTVQIMADEPWIPWELVKLQGKEEGRVVEGPFLCEAFAMTRWFPGIGRRPELGLKRIGLVVPSDSGLHYAPEERDFMLGLGNGKRQVAQVPANYLDVVDALSGGEYDAWHFSGHGQYLSRDPNISAIYLEQDQQLYAAEICGQVGNCGLSHPLVFLNACQTGRETLSLTGIGGWARQFIEVGAAGFVGSLWSVYDQAAFEFCKEFYNHLLGGQPVGQAAKEARQTIRALEDPTWLAYTVFADPFAAVR